MKKNKSGKKRTSKFVTAARYSQSKEIDRLNREDKVFDKKTKKFQKEYQAVLEKTYKNFVEETGISMEDFSSSNSKIIRYELLHKQFSENLVETENKIIDLKKKEKKDPSDPSLLTGYQSYVNSVKNLLEAIDNLYEPREYLQRIYNQFNHSIVPAFDDTEIDNIYHAFEKIEYKYSDIKLVLKEKEVTDLTPIFENYLEAITRIFIKRDESKIMENPAYSFFLVETYNNVCELIIENIEDTYLVNLMTNKIKKRLENSENLLVNLDYEEN